MDPITGAALISGGASVIGSITSALGARSQNANSNAQAGIERQWQEKLIRNAHKYEVDDLRNAGLNPILSAKLGGSSTGHAGIAQQVNEGSPYEALGAGATSALQTRLNAMATKESIATQKSQQNLNSAQSVQARAAAIKTLIDAQKTKGEIKSIRYENFFKDIIKRSREKNPVAQEWLQGLKDVIGAASPQIFVPR